MKKYFIYILFIVISGLILLTGCRWFADNPMFPTGKFEVSYKVLKEDGQEAPNGILGVVSVTDITNTSVSSDTATLKISDIYKITIKNDGEVSITTTTTENSYDQTVTQDLSSKETYEVKIAVTFARVVEFTFSPINNVGAEIQDCEVVYTDNKGLPIDSLRKNLAVYLYLPPFGSSEEPEKDASRTLKLEIFDKSTQDYYINHNIPFGQAIITFNGLDGAGHPIALKKAISINADMIDDSLQDEIDQQIQEIMQNQGQNPGSSCSYCS